VFRGARENPVRMSAIGFEIYRYQLIAYCISGAIGGLAGFLLANATDFVSPAYMSWQRSGELIIMVLFGGFGTLHGAIVGAAAFLLLEDMLGGITENWKLIFGPMLVLIVVENEASLPKAVANSLRVFNASGADATRFATAVITNEVFAIFVEESPAVTFGVVGEPDSAGDASGA
jgi:branched-chain amino acid transport system permease protein